MLIERTFDPKSWPKPPPKLSEPVQGRSLMKSANGDLRTMLTLSARAAKKRNRQPSTGFLLLALLQNDEQVSALLVRHGVNESRLLWVLKTVEEESERALERTVERAQKIYVSQSQKGHPRGMDVLAAICKEVRTEAYKSLQKLGVHAQVLLGEIELIFHSQSGEASLNMSFHRGGAEATNQVQPGDRKRSFPQFASTQNAKFEPDFPLIGTALRKWIVPKNQSSKSTLNELQKGNESMGDGKSGGLDEVKKARSKKIHHVQQKLDLSSQPKVKKTEVNTNASNHVSTPDPYELVAEEFPLLCSLGRNLTLLANQGELDLVGGREAELEQLLDVLAKRRSNNPILVGPPGVGKTTLVEGLANALVSQSEGTHGFQDYLIIELSAGSLVSGTAVRGALVEKIRALKEEVHKATQKIVLFIDEIHALLGEAAGPDDMVQELKSSLARGELPCIGATTDDEYRKYIEKDPAFARRFSLIRVDEPSEEKTIDILEQTINRYEMHHGLAFHPDAIRAAVKLSVRFLPDQFLPDKAIGVLDHAAARVSRRGGEWVDERAVSEVVSEVAKVPLDLMVTDEKERFLSLGNVLRKKIVGHAHVMEGITQSLQKASLGFQGRCPLGSFLFLGPSGVGKTETAKVIAEALFPKGAVLRLDMSEFSESHSVARLLGAPPGYVGHEDGGQLTEPIRRQPYQLVLLDELEKAHREVLLALLPLLDEGHLTDGRGRTIDFTNTVVVMTSNLGAECVVGKERSIGFGSSAIENQTNTSSDVESIQAHALEVAKQSLPVEFWNRLDAAHWFAPLGQKEISQILLLRLKEFTSRLLKEKGIFCEVQPSAVQALLSLSKQDLKMGARPIQRLLSQWVQNPIADLMLRGQLKPGNHLEVSGKHGKIQFTNLTALKPATLAG